MDELVLERIDDIAVFRPVPLPSAFPQAVQLGSAAIAKARDEGIGKLMLVGSQFTFEPPSVAERHQMAREWADIAQGRVAVALVVPPAFIDPERFAVAAARNFGLIANAFETEVDAIAWLRNPH